LRAPRGGTAQPARPRTSNGSLGMLAFPLRKARPVIAATHPTCFRPRQAGTPHMGRAVLEGRDERWPVAPQHHAVRKKRAARRRRAARRTARDPARRPADPRAPAADPRAADPRAQSRRRRREPVPPRRPRSPGHEAAASRPRGARQRHGGLPVSPARRTTASWARSRARHVRRAGPQWLSAPAPPAWPED